MLFTNAFSKIAIIAISLIFIIQKVDSGPISSYNTQPLYKYQPIYTGSFQYPSNGYYPGISSPVIGQYPGVIIQYPIYGTIPVQGQIPIQQPVVSEPSAPLGDAPPQGGVFLDHDTVSVDAAY